MTLTPYVTQDRAPDDLKEAVAELIQLDAASNANIPKSLRAPMIHLQRQVSLPSHPLVAPVFSMGTRRH